MTTREPKSVTARALKRPRLGWIAASLLNLLACHDDYDPERHMAEAAKKDAGARPTSSGTNMSPATAESGKDGGASDGASTAAPASTDGGGSAAGQGVTTEAGTVSGGGDGSAAPAAGPVVAACMGHGGETVCDGATLIRCGMAGDAESQTACSSEVRCRAGLMTGKCGACDPGTPLCMGADLHECSANGEFVRKEPCASEALCSAANKSCNPTQCGMDTYKCEGVLLKKCKPDLSGFDEGTPCDRAELCSDVDKRCNECVPGSKICSEDTVMTCSADGKGPTAMHCDGMTPRCQNGKCVQCKGDTDCMTAEQCRVSTCNVGTGMCVIGTAPRKTKCSLGVCDLLGSCSQCVDDADCKSGQFCDWGTCRDRRPLTASSFLGSCSVTLSGGYSLLLEEPVGSEGSTITVTGSEFILDAFGGAITVNSLARRLVGPTSQARTFNISATSQMGAVSCSTISTAETNARLMFEVGGGIELLEFKLVAQK